MKPFFIAFFAACFLIPVSAMAASYDGQADYDRLAAAASSYIEIKGEENVTDEGITEVLEAALTYVPAGTVVPIADGKINVTVPKGYTFIPRGQALFLYEIVQQEKATSDDRDAMQGILVSNGKFFDRESINVYLTYIDDGHVSDEDAASIDGDKMAADFDKQSERDNRNVGEGEIRKENHAWLIKPRYDALNRIFEYATSFDEVLDGEVLGSTVNSSILILGRTGHLVVIVVGNASENEIVTNAVKDVRTAIQYTPGNKYTDYDPSTDKKSDFSIGAIAAGALGVKVLAKLGVWAVIAKFGKVIIVGALAIWLKFKTKIKGFFAKKPPVV